MWVRFRDELPDQSIVHASALQYAIDLLMGEPWDGATIVRSADGRWGSVQPCTVDVSVRFHRGFRADDWMRYEQWIETAAGHRALLVGRAFSSMGRLVASSSREVGLAPNTQSGELPDAAADLEESSA
jgi:acyl-CoA thioesterase-2